jgi:hypothetical protein
MSSYLPKVPFSTLEVGNHTQYQYRKHPLNIRVNQWNEVEHIGFVIFTDEIRNQLPNLVCDFLERYFLDLMMHEEVNKDEQMYIDKVFVTKGSLVELFNITGNEDFLMNYIGFTKYKVTWSRDGNVLLELLFDMDYQLLSGCNALELEKLFLRDLNRFPYDTSYATVLPTGIDTCLDRYFVQTGETYLHEAIRNDRFYARDSLGRWNLLCEKEKPYWSAYNILLSPQQAGRFNLVAKLDEYGYKTRDFEIDMQQWIDYCRKHCDNMYFGIKARTDTTLQGTVYIPNETEGFCHVLSVEIPLKTIENGTGPILGRLFVYIPLHNIVEDYFSYKYNYSN